MGTILRREEKYHLNLQEALVFSHRFSQILIPDEFSVNGSYIVRSLYFDTADDKDFVDKLTEQNVRKKIRLRIYNSADIKAKLELKQKENVYQKKRSLIISKEDALELIKGNYSILLQYQDEFATEMYTIMSTGVYRPKTIVEYDRKAFNLKENNIRLTFDSRIRATESSVDLFADNLPLLPVYPQNKVIFEVKYDKFMLGYISDIISMVNTRSVTSSKYCMGRSLSYPMYL